MREILFRGKRKDDGKWVVGFLVSHAHVGDWVTAEPIAPETVGQYTGMTDKNGKKIFEGDIVDCWSEGVNAKGTVQQRRDGLWIIYPAWQKKIMWGLCPDEYSKTTVEVVGNVYDNPELLEVKDKWSN